VYHTVTSAFAQMCSVRLSVTNVHGGVPYESAHMYSVNLSIRYSGVPYSD